MEDEWKGRRMVYLYIAAWILCLYAFCVRPQRINKIYDTGYFSVMELAVLALVFLLITANQTGPDIVSYVKSYEADTYQYTREPLYTLLKYVFHHMGVSFYVFRAVLTFLTGLPAMITIKKTGADIRFMLLFYLPSMIFMDSMQFRNAIAFWLMIWSLRYFVQEEKYAAVKYVIFILLIAQIHTAYYFALILAVGFLKKRRKQIAVVIFAAGVFLAVLTLCNGKQVPMLVFFLEHFLAKDDSRTWKYVTSGNFGWIIPTGIHAVTTIVSTAVNRHAHKDHSKMAKKQLEYLDLVWIYNMVLFLTVPAIMMNMHYYRLVRGAFMLNVAGISYLYQKGTRPDRFRCLIFGLLVLLTGFWFVLDMVIFEKSAVMAGPVLEGRLFFLPHSKGE